MKWIILPSILYSSLCLADLAPLNEQQLQQVDGQAGITLSGRMEFDAGTRFSYQNEDAEYIDNTAYWLVMEEVTGGFVFSDMKLDIIDGIGPNGDKTAMQITLPDELVFEQLQTEGFYLGDNREVNQMSDSRFLYAVELDGKLQAPAQTKVNIFPVN